MRERERERQWHAGRGRATIIDACQSPERRAPIVRGTITRVDEKKNRERERKRELGEGERETGRKRAVTRRGRGGASNK